MGHVSLIMTSRSGTPLIYRAFPVWFVRVQPIIDQLVANNAETRWYDIRRIHTAFE